MEARTGNSYRALRPVVLGLTKAFVLGLAQFPSAQTVPRSSSLSLATEEEGTDPGNPGQRLYLSVVAAPVLLGGAFAGLTIALMGKVNGASTVGIVHPLRSKDKIYLQVIRDSGEGAEKTPQQCCGNIGFWSLCC